jgi:hypothetical protein
VHEEEMPCQVVQSSYPHHVNVNFLIIEVGDVETRRGGDSAAIEMHVGGAWIAALQHSAMWAHRPLQFDSPRKTFLEQSMDVWQDPRMKV